MNELRIIPPITKGSFYDKHSPLRCLVLALTCVLAILLAAVFDAKVYGQVSGLVLDAGTGKPIANAKVEIVKSEFATLSDAQGQFIIQHDLSGDYGIKAAMIGYDDEIKTAKVAIQNATAIDFHLERKMVALDEVVVSATRRASNLAGIPAFASVVSNQQVKSNTATDAGELLKSSGLLQVADYGIGSLSSVSLRGSSYEQVLVLVDGDRINSSLSGGADFNNIPLNSVERIEIVRGGQSALYGADAMGGIINIVTKRSNKDKLNTWSKIGSFGSFAWGAEVGKKVGALSALVSFSQDKSDGDFQYFDKWDRPRTRENAQFAKRDVAGRLDYQFSRAKLAISGTHYYADKGDPGPIGQFNKEAFREDKSNSLLINYDHEPRENFSYKLKLHGRGTSLHYANPAGPYNTDDTHKSKSVGGELQTQIYLSDSSPLTTGFSLRQEDISSTAVGTRERNTISGYIQQELALNIPKNFLQLRKIVLFPALRWDNYSDFDAGISPKLGVLARFFEHGNFALRASIGKSYRAPTLNELFWPSDAFAQGNPNLKPERSFGFEFGFNFALPCVRGSVAYFQRRSEDRIQWSPKEGGKWTPENLSEANIRGVEIEANSRTLKCKDFALNLSASSAFLKAQDARERQLLYQPKFSANYGLRVAYKSLWAQLEGLYNSKRYYTRENTKWLAPFLAHNIRWGYEKSLLNDTKLSVILELRNAFDDSYQLIADYPLPGREWRFKVGVER